MNARQCRGCGRLLHARDQCGCDTQVVHLVTDLGPTDGPGLLVPAKLLGPALHARTAHPDRERMPLWYYTAQPMTQEKP